MIRWLNSTNGDDVIDNSKISSGLSYVAQGTDELTDKQRPH